MKEIHHSIDLFNEGILDKLMNPKLKCPICKKKTQFRAVDVNCSEGHVYILGNYGRLVSCERCHIVLAFEEQKLKDLETKK